MANIHSLNQQNPFWDWISQFENSCSNHPFFNAYNPGSRDPRGPPPYDGAAPPHHEGPPPPPSHEGPPSPHGSHGPPPHEGSFGPGFPFGGPHHGGPHHHGHRGGWGGRRGPGRCGGGFGGSPMMGGANFDPSKIAEFISQFIPEDMLSGGNHNTKSDSTNKDKDFTPPADIFDTEDAYVIHVSLPGAKKEDVGVNWDADKNELNVAGVRYRPGDEEFLKTLVLEERKVGVFERKIRLGSQEKPAQVDAEGIAAKMEDGLLIVTIPKVKLEEGFVEVKKVDIE